jgi:hypothetical protein
VQISILASRRRSKYALPASLFARSTCRKIEFQLCINYKSLEGHRTVSQQPPFIRSSAEGQVSNRSSNVWGFLFSQSEIRVDLRADDEGSSIYQNA